MANEFKVKKGLIVDGTNTVLDIQGTQGQLFSVTDGLTGDLFSVSDVSGIPIFNVNSSGLSTFDGDMKVDGGEVEITSSDNDTILTIANTKSGGETWKIHSASSSSAPAIASGDFLIRNGSTNVLRLGSNNQANFAGDVNVDGNAIFSNWVHWDLNGGEFAGDPRAIVMGYSGGNYGSIGYNIAYTSTSNSHTRAFSDIPTRMDLYDGILLYSSATGSAGTAISWTELLQCQSNNFEYKSNDIFYNGYSGNATFAGRVKGVNFTSTENAATGGFPASRDYLIAGTGDRGGGLVISDISGARHALYAGGHDLTFAKETDDGAGTISHDIWMRANAANSAGNVTSLQFFKDSTFSGNVTAVNVIPTTALRIGAADKWKIRGNNSNDNLAFEYAASETLADTNIKLELTSTGATFAGTATFAGDVRVTGGQLFLTASNYAIENVSNNYGIRNSSGNYGGSDDTNAYTTPQDFFHIPGIVRIGPKFATTDRDHIRIVPAGSTSTIEMPNENAYIHNNVGNIVLRTGTSTDAVTVSGANTAFAGNLSTAADKRISIGTWDNSAFTSGNAYGYYVSSGTPMLILEESDQSKTGYVGVSGGNMYVGGAVTSLILQSGNGSNALTINSSQNATFAGKVKVQGDPPITPNTNFDDLVITDSAHAGMSIFSGGTDKHGAIYFGDDDGNNIGQIKYLHNNDTMTFATAAGSASLTLSSGSDATFAGHITTNGGQILTPSGVNLALNPNTGIVSVGGVIQASGTGNNTFAGTVNITGTNDLIISNGSLTSSQSSTTNPVARFTDTGVANYDWTFPDNSIVQLNPNTSSTKTFKLHNSGAGGFNIQASSATFNDNTSATGSAILDVQGTAGQLFSVTNSLSGDLFSVSDVSGIPILNVDSSGLSTFTGDVTIDKDSARLVLQDTGTGNALNQWISYTDSAGTERAYLGYGSTGNSNFYVVNHLSDLMFYAGGVHNSSMSSTATTFEKTAIFNGDMTLPAAADHFLIGAGSLQTTSRIKFGLPTWNNSIGLESYWMVMRSNQNEGYKFIDSTGTIYVQFNASNNSAGALEAYFKGTVEANKYTFDGNASNPTSTTASIYDQSSVGLTISAHNVSIRNYNGSAMMESARFVHNNLTVAGDVIAYGSPSDVRLKENIKPIESALDKVSKLQGVTFDWKESDSILDIKEDIGFIAQDVKEVVPELVRENEDGMLSMRHQGIAPILLEAIKELKAEIEELKKQIK